jgi:hypothetical protein
MSFNTMSRKKIRSLNSIGSVPAIVSYTALCKNSPKMNLGSDAQEVASDHVISL